MAEIKIGALTFPSKKAARAHFSDMLWGYGIGEIIPEPAATEVQWLLERHPDAAWKIGPGVAHFSVCPTIFEARAFDIIRVDGTHETFSYIRALDGAPSPLARALQAMRAEVMDDILTAKRAYYRENAGPGGYVPCALTGVPVPIEEAHADHAPPYLFTVIATAFLAARNIVPDASFVAWRPDSPHLPLLADRQLAAAWRTYHHGLVAIRIVAKRENLRRSAEGRTRKRDRQLLLAPPGEGRT